MGRREGIGRPPFTWTMMRPDLKVPSTDEYVVPATIPLGSGRRLETWRVVKERIQGRLEKEVAWFERVPIASMVLGRVFEEVEAEELEMTLGDLGEANVRLLEGGHTLRTADIQRIGAIVRRTQGEPVLRGSLYALAGSRFLRIIEPIHVARMLRVAGPHSRFFAGLFSGRLNASLSDSAGSLLEDVATIVSEEFDQYPLDIAVAATRYLAEQVEPDLPPITKGVA